MTKWENKFVNEDIDLHVFLTLDDEDLKKIGKGLGLTYANKGRVAAL